MKREYDFRGARRGPVVPVPPGKTRITIRLDDDVLEWFRSQVHAAGGGNYQTIINEALRNFIGERHEAIAETLRKVLHEELAPSSLRRRATARRRAGTAASRVR